MIRFKHFKIIYAFAVSNLAISENKSISNSKLTKNQYMCPGVTKGTFRRDFHYKKIRFYKAVENFLKKNFLCEFAYKLPDLPEVISHLV